MGNTYMEKLKKIIKPPSQRAELELGDLHNELELGVRLL
jgi:hypothetical protein